MMRLGQTGWENRIGRRLIVLIVAFSSFLAVLATGYQLYAEYRHQRADMDGMLEEVRFLLPLLAGSVWTLDERQITLALEAVTRLPHITRASVTTSDGRNTWSAGTTASRNLVARRYRLAHDVRGETQEIGTLDVSASLDGIYGRLLSQAITILVSNTIKTFLVATFMYVAFSRIVTRRVEELARNVGTLVPESLLARAALPGHDPGFPENGDEIDGLRWAYDNIAHRLKIAAEDLRNRHAELELEIQERTRAQSDLQRVIAELSRTNAELERFAYIATHDLQEPVRGLVSFSQLLERKFSESLGGDAKDYLRFIIKDAHRISDLLRDLLEYSRAGRQGLALGEVDCQEVVDSVMQSLTPTIERKQAELRISLMPRLVADRMQLYQVFLNLIGNALRYCTATRPVVEVKAEHQDAAWRFEVADNGDGIDPQYHDYVFEVFRRLHTGASYPGTGIGLAICKRIVESHGGRMWLRSAPGEGASFFFSIPDAVADGDGGGHP